MRGGPRFADVLNSLCCIALGSKSNSARVAYSRLTGLQFETISSLSNQSAKSCEFPTVAESVMICASGNKCLIRARFISIVGPLWLSFTKWNSSATTTETLLSTSDFDLINESNFSLVHTKMSQSSICLASFGASPIPRPIFKPRLSPICLSSPSFSDAKAFNGTM